MRPCAPGRAPVLALCVFFFQAEDGIRDYKVTGVQTCALPIYAFQEAHEIVPPVLRDFVPPTAAQLVVRHVGDARSTLRGCEPEAQCRSRMPQLDRADSELPDRELFHIHLLHRQRRGQRVERHGEHRRIHLLPENRFQRGRPLASPPDADGIARREERFEVRQPLDVVPMRVRQQDFYFYRAVLFLDQLQPQRTDARPSIEHDQLTPGAFHGDARRVPAVARGCGARSRNTPAGSPKGHRVSHAFRRADRAKLLAVSDVEQVAASPARRDASHAPRPAACSRAPRSRMTMSLRLTSIIPLSTSSRMVRDTVSRDDPIIWAMVWWVSRRVMRWPSVSSARSRSSWATRPCTSSRTRLPTFSSTRRKRRDSSRSSASPMPGECSRMP